MAAEIDELRAKIARIERELRDAKTEIDRISQRENGGTKPRRFADLEGIWKGVDFSDEEIEAAKYQLDDDDHIE